MKKDDISIIINKANDIFGDANEFAYKRKGGWLMNIQEAAGCTKAVAEKVFYSALRMKLLIARHICSHDYHYYIVNNKSEVQDGTK